MSTIYDYVVIGGGVAGLHANYILSKKKLNGIVIEKNQTVFGRVREREFHGKKIKCAAGIAVPGNKLLIKLFKKLGMPVKFTKGGITDLVEPAFDMKDAVARVKKVFKTMTKKDLNTLTSKEILYKYFDEEDFADKFIEHSEFLDYLDGSFEYLMKFYPIDDLDNQPFKLMGVDWTMLVEKLVLPNIRTECEVTNIEKTGKIFMINGEIRTKKIIFAVTVGTLTKIKTNFKMPDIEKYVGSTPFARVYAFYENGHKFDGSYVKTGGVVDKIVKIDGKILMASYSDGDNALFWGDVKKMNGNKQSKIVEDKLKEVGINLGKPDDVFIASWKDGVHHIKPYGAMRTIDNLLNKLSNPHKNVWVIGEMLSKRAGYVEGALLSVERMLKNYMKT